MGVRMTAANFELPLNGRGKRGYLRLRDAGRLGAKACFWLLAILGLLLPPRACVAQSAPANDAVNSRATESSALFNQVIANQKRVDADLNLYERIEREEIRKSGSDLKPSAVKVWRVFPAGTGTDKIPLTTEGKPPSAASYREALEKLQTALEWAAKEGAAQQEAYNKQERRRKERDDLIDATRKAFFFTRIGEETRENRVLVKYEMAPNPGYKPASRNEMLFTKVHGTIWIDKETSELAKVEGSVTEDISLALFLAKVYRGSYFMQERYEVTPGVWLPSYQQYDFDGRKFLIPFSIHERTLYSDYRRVGPPKEAVAVVRDELDKLKGVHGDP